MVDEGEVTLNGEVEYRKRAKLRQGDVIKTNGNEIVIKDQKHCD